MTNNLLSLCLCVCFMYLMYGDAVKKRLAKVFIVLQIATFKGKR